MFFRDHNKPKTSPFWGYTAIFALPFWRLRCKTFFPLEDFDLTRKPWVFALFLLFGLYVKDIDKIYTKTHHNARLSVFLQDKRYPHIHRLYTG